MPLPWVRRCCPSGAWLLPELSTMTVGDRTEGAHARTGDAPLAGHCVGRGDRGGGGTVSRRTTGYRGTSAGEDAHQLRQRPHDMYRINDFRRVLTTTPASSPAWPGWP